MNTLHPGETASVWLETKTMPRYSPLTGDLEVDVCVVGGGIAGLSTAYFLMREGKSVALLEGFELASGQTGKTTAHFVTALDDRFFNIERLHGEKGMRVAAESHSAAIERVAQIIASEEIECGLERLDGYLFAPEENGRGILEKELDAARRAGLHGVELIESSPFGAAFQGPALLFPRQMQLHPLEYLGGLAERFVARGGRIFTHTHVSEIHGGPRAFVKTSDGHTVRCGSIVVATNTPVNDVVAIHTKQAPYRTYALGFSVPKGSVPRALCWDTLDPYHYVRLEGGRGGSHEILIVGGEDHKTGQDERPRHRFDWLETWARQKFPMASELLYRWSGQVMEPVDGIGFLGHNPLDRNNVYVITGDSGNGMTHATIGGMLITDQILGRPNPWEELYRPSRIRLAATPEFLKENGNVAAQYGKWLNGGERTDLALLPPGEGAVFREGLRKIAAYRNHAGELEYFSAACTHLKGLVSWNPVEKSWDCPCHGARFDCHGTVIEGPANKDLERVSPREAEGAPEIPGISPRAAHPELPPPSVVV